MEETLLQQNEEMETIDNDCETIEDGESVETKSKVGYYVIAGIAVIGEVLFYEKCIRPTAIKAKDSIKNMIENRREKARIRKEEKMENENNKQ